MPRRNRTGSTPTGHGRRWLPTGQPLAPHLALPPAPDHAHVRRHRDNEQQSQATNERSNDERHDDEPHDDADEPWEGTGTSAIAEETPQRSTPCQVTRNMYGFHIPETGNELRMSESAS